MFSYLFPNLGALFISFSLCSIYACKNHSVFMTISSWAVLNVRWVCLFVKCTDPILICCWVHWRETSQSCGSIRRYNFILPWDNNKRQCKCLSDIFVSLCHVEMIRLLADTIWVFVSPEIYIHATKYLGFIF